MFSKAWLAHDPNEPDYDPSDPNEYAIWSSARDYNFDKDGDSQHQIDFADLLKLANDWLWQACWKDFDRGFAMMTMGGGGESMTAAPVQPTSFVAAAPEPTIEERIEQTEDALDFFNEVMEDEELKETINLDNLQKVIDALEAQLEELENSL